MFTAIFTMVNFLLYIVFGSVTAVTYSKLPNNFVQCKINDSDFDECVRTELQRAIPQLAMGNQNLGLLKMDPLRISTLVIEQGTESIILKLNFKDLDIINMGTLSIKKSIYDPVNYTMSVVSDALKPIILEGLYDVNGRVLFLPITGNGHCKISLDNFKLSSNIKMTPIAKNGTVYLEIHNLSWKFTTTKLHIKLNNLFGGDRVLGDHMNVFLNENWRELLEEMQPSFEKALGFAFVGIIQQFLNRIPLNRIFIS